MIVLPETSVTTLEVKRRQAKAAKRAATPSRRAVIWALLALETTLTVPFFLVSWLVCATGFAARAGFLMAKEGSEEVKEEILKKVLGLSDIDK